MKSSFSSFILAAVLLSFSALASPHMNSQPSQLLPKFASDDKANQSLITKLNGVAMQLSERKLQLHDRVFDFSVNQWATVTGHLTLVLVTPTDPNRLSVSGIAWQQQSQLIWQAKISDPDYDLLALLAEIRPHKAIQYVEVGLDYTPIADGAIQ